jgi:hypothetical protein
MLEFLEVRPKNLLGRTKKHPAAETAIKDSVLSGIIDSDGGHLDRRVMISVTRAFVHCSKRIAPMTRLDYVSRCGASAALGS